METIIKRDGKLAEFDEAKITDAIEKHPTLQKNLTLKLLNNLQEMLLELSKTL